MPPALAKFLIMNGWDALHISNADLDETPDRDIWRMASHMGCVIISKDEDFVHFATAEPFGPQLIWVRLGNCRPEELISAFARLLPEITTSLEEGERIVEIR
ncbi:MAG: DUF5615 family PIN-like protein [Planctomycetes bacterium]|nr:DUF5615 family PIN-like protein [Planctomycetota bacterium]